MTSVRIQLCLVIGARMNRNTARTVLSDSGVIPVFLYNAHRKQQTGPYTQYAASVSTGCFWQLVGHNNV